MRESESNAEFAARMRGMRGDPVRPTPAEAEAEAWIQQLRNYRSSPEDFMDMLGVDRVKPMPDFSAYLKPSKLSNILEDEVKKLRCKAQDAAPPGATGYDLEPIMGEPYMFKIRYRFD